MFDKTLFLLITCCLDETRTSVLSEVVKNLKQEDRRTHFFDKLLVFDNGSTDPRALNLLKEFPHVVRSDKNAGYWSAVDWCLRNYQKHIRGNFDFVYIIESDLIHYKMEKLAVAEDFLTKNPDVGSVRTQKFSVLWRSFFNKESRLSKWTHDAVSFSVFPTEEPLKLQKSSTHKGIYVSNFHGKLVGLNRLKFLQEVFEHLADKTNISEGDYFTEYHLKFAKTGVLDGGIFTEKLASRLMTKKVVVASHLSENAKQTGYIATRVTRILRDGFNVSPLT